MIPKTVFDIRWPRFSPYPPVVMGMIQPEWLYFYHVLSGEEEAEEEKTEELEEASAPPASPPRINIRPRPPESDRQH